MFIIKNRTDGRYLEWNRKEKEHQWVPGADISGILPIFSTGVAAYDEIEDRKIKEAVIQTVVKLDPGYNANAQRQWPKEQLFAVNEIEGALLYATPLSPMYCNREIALPVDKVLEKF